MTQRTLARRYQGCKTQEISLFIASPPRNEPEDAPNDHNELLRFFRGTCLCETGGAVGKYAGFSLSTEIVASLPQSQLQIREGRTHRTFVLTFLIDLPPPLLFLASLFPSISAFAFYFCFGFLGCFSSSNCMPALSIMRASLRL